MHTTRAIRMSMVFLVMAVTARAGWLDGWQHRRSITVNTGQVEADLTNFPVLVRLTAGQFDFALAATDGHDVRFTDSDGTTALDFERESHSASAGSAAYWVRHPLLSPASNTTFYLYYGNAGSTDSAAPAAVWDTAHVGVWHLQGTNGVTQADSTAGANHVTVGPAALAANDVAISDCDSLADWTGTSLSLDGTNKDPNGGSVKAVKDTVASTALGQTNTIVFNPAAPLVLGQRRLNFYIRCTKVFSDKAGFTSVRVYLYDTAGNYRYHIVGYWSAALWRYMGFGIGAEGTTGGTAPDVNAIDRIEWVFVSKDSTAYDVQIDSLNANGAMEEGMAEIIGGGIRLSGNDHYLVTSQAQSIGTANGITYSAWVRPHRYAVPNSCDNLQTYVVSIGGANWSYYWCSYFGYRDQGKIFSFSEIGSDEVPTPLPKSAINTTGFSTGVWSHVASTYRFDPVASNTTVACYINGVVAISNTVVGPAMRTTAMDRPIYLGAVQWASGMPDKIRGFLNGDMDEVRVSNVRRSDAWIKASFLNQKADSSFVSLGNAESTASWLGGWKYRRAITVNSSDIDADLTNFPVLVRLSADCFDFGLAATDGHDVRFTDAGGGASLAFEREAHDAAAGEAAYWVRLPLVSATSNTVFYLYNGNSVACDMATPAGVWDDAHVGVWHLQGTNGATQADATKAANTLTVGPAALDAGDLAISDCDSLADWTGTSLSLDGTNKDPNGGSGKAIKDTVASVVIGQTNTIVFNPSEPLALGQRRLDFFIRCTTSNTAFSTLMVYIYDTAGNYRYHDLGVLTQTHWRYMGYGIGAEGTTGGTAPDVNAIDRIEWVFVAGDDKPYDVQLDTVFANGALEEGEAGVVGDGVRFSGYDQHLITTQAQSIDTADGLTYSAWVRPHPYYVSQRESYSAYIVACGGGSWDPYWLSAIGYYSQGYIYGYSANGYYEETPRVTVSEKAAGFSTGVWSHVAASYFYDPVTSNTTMKCYINGAQVFDKVVTNRALRAVMDRPIVLGAIKWTSSGSDYIRCFFNGDMDEVRVSNVRRSDAWIKASYINQAPGSALLSFGGLEPPRGAVILVK